jgi:hypothetical protein
VGNISVDYDVLNQKGSPAWYSDLFANIPTPGYKGRMFISTDTFAFYRDNGVGWDLVGGPGTGTITGAGVSGQLTYFIGTDVISGNNNLFYDITNGRLGINTTTPGSPLDIHSTGTAAQFNGTGVNNAFVLFQNAGTSKWRIGNLYNSGANDYQIYDVLNATARLTIKNTGATTLTGTFTATSLIKSGGTSSQILLADGTTTPTSTFGAGSVTSVSAITLGTSGTDLSSSVANSTTTPVITLNVPTASATNRGALSSADWTTFNNKQATLSLTTTGTSGAATLVGATLNIPNYTNVGTVTSVAALTLGTSGTDLSSSVANSTSTPVITLNVPTASATNRGALSSADFTTFNNKQATISVTAPVVLTGATISMPAATTSVNGYLTSTDWNTFNNKSNTNGTVTSVVALTIGTSGIDITSTAVTTTTTPVITLNIPTASASNRGALSSTDWTTFNNKQATLSLTTTGTSGVATLVANTLNIPNYSSALSGYLPLTGGTLTGPLSINYGGGQFTLLRTSFNTFSFGTGTSGSISGLVISDNTASTNPLVIEQTTGYATFVGNVETQSRLIVQTATSPTATGQIGYGSDAGLYIWPKAGTTYAYTLYSNTGNETMRIPTGTTIANFPGKIGIGTTTPSRKLIISGGTSDSGLEVLSVAGNRIGLLASRGSSGAGLEQGYFQMTDTGTAKVVLDTAGNSYFNGGNVGINTNAPSYQLTIKPTAYDSETFVITRIDSDGYQAVTLGTENTANGYIRLRDSANASLVKISTSGNSYFNGGNVGIGTASPGQKLVINTSGGSPSINIYDGTSDCYLGIATSASGYANGTSAGDLVIRGASGVSFSSNGGSSVALRLSSTNIAAFISRGNFLGATDNALFSLNSGGTLYTVGFSPTATASSTNTLTLTTGTTTWIYTGTGTATWTLPNPSGNNQIYWIKNAGTGIITLNAYSGTNIINNAAASVSSITIAVGSTAVIAQDGNVKSYQLQ